MAADAQNTNKRFNEKMVTDDDLVAEFHNQRQNYYKNMPKKGEVFKTGEGDLGMGGDINNLLKMNAIKVESRAREAKMREDKNETEIFQDLNSITQDFLPVFESRQKQLKDALITQMKNAELEKFNDDEYVEEFVDEMREQI